MTVRPVVLDACVLVPISLCGVVLDLADAAMFQPLWSRTILDETCQALVERRGVPADRAEHRVAKMEAAYPDALVAGFEPLIPSMGNDPKDRHVLAVAVQAACPVIVTANLTGFPASALACHGIEAASPDMFLLGLLDDGPDIVLRAVDAKRTTFRHPPRTMVQSCGILATTVSRFAARLASATGSPWGT